MEKGLEYYESLFRRCGGNQTRIVMDATPKYMLHAENVRKIYEDHGSADTVKIMFTLREPVSRELSWYRHLVSEMMKPKPLPWSKVVLNQTSGTILSFEEYVETVVIPSLRNPSDAARGLYAHWLRKWLALFDRRQILVASYDDFRRNETEYLARVHSFLDLPDRVPTRKTPIANNKRVPAGLPISCHVQTQLAKVFEPYNEELYQLLRDHPMQIAGVVESDFPRFHFQCIET
jgi:Sulfotransferase domain